jgi:hypothetical protein
MDKVDEVLLRAMIVGGIGADELHKERLNGLVESGLVEAVRRQPPFPGYLTPLPVYQLTALGHSIVRALEGSKPEN